MVLIAAGTPVRATAIATSLPSATPAPIAVAAATPTPFWKAKTEVYRRMKEERATIVSAHKDDFNGKKRLTLVTAGIMRVPVGFAHPILMDFANYAHFLPYIEESSYDKTTQNVFVHGSFLKSHVRMTIHVKSVETKDGYQITWESIAGGFLGMKGVVDENKIDNTHAEISMTSNYVGETIPLPDFLLNWGLEYAGQKVGNAMRSHIEDEYEKSKKH